MNTIKIAIENNEEAEELYFTALTAKKLKEYIKDCKEEMEKIGDIKRDDFAKNYSTKLEAESYEAFCERIKKFRISYCNTYPEKELSMASS